MTFYKFFKSFKNKEFDRIELHYSFFHFLSGNPKWFCRIWINRYKKSGESYGKNKFEAYRNAIKDLK